MNYYKYLFLSLISINSLNSFFLKSISTYLFYSGMPKSIEKAISKKVITSINVIKNTDYRNINKNEKERIIEGLNLSVDLKYEHYLKILNLDEKFIDEKDFKKIYNEIKPKLINGERINEYRKNEKPDFISSVEDSYNKSIENLTDFSFIKIALNMKELFHLTNILNQSKDEVYNGYYNYIAMKIQSDYLKEVAEKNARLELYKKNKYKLITGSLSSILITKLLEESLKKDKTIEN